MANTVKNLTRPGIYAKHSTVTAWVEQCAAEWVITGVTFRELNREERLERMMLNKEHGKPLNFIAAPSKRSDYLPILEPDGHHWEPPKAEKYTQYMRSELVVAARQFCQQSVTQVESLS